jgi:hypothetical protein
MLASGRDGTVVALVDIVPQTRTVPIAGGQVELRARSAPDRRSDDTLSRPASLDPEGRAAFGIDALLLAAPDAVGAIIAEAARQPETADAITGCWR